jgi:hypothetical protein
MVGTDIPKWLAPYLEADGTGWHAQLVPTLLFKKESSKQGEIWRILVVQEREGGKSGPGLFDDFCLTNIDTATYASLPVNEVVFWHEEGLVELPAFQVAFKVAGDKGMETASWPASFANMLQHIIS